ncbi:Proteasome lid subunit RPN8/RPN11, contains Jab1/MPN metalloenzyme (JAMM) motif [Singulisphaera sp. GP187]|nr:Proteasome lid subunit RPN8/RPN11, contains Jab1/MPN metalloenzyme (JAMM) motif [Singulisphaera sp. GP187]
MVFDDVKYREPERRCRPDRDRRWACLAYGLPGVIDLPIYLDRETADLIERHALRDTSVELGGILLGKECLDEKTGLPFVMVTRSLEAKHYENTQASFTYTHDSWEEITRERDRLHPDLDIVGWYHTHPDFGIFLSSHDQFIHRHFFAQPLQVAYVVDPIRQTRGFFQWRDGELEEVEGYYLYTDRADRIALTRLVNDLENFPNAEGGGGGLSPRLEAQLIAMLTRPVTHHATTVDRTQTAVLFSLIGSLVGMLVLAAGLVLYQMYQEVADQARTLKDLQESTGEIVSAQRLALDSLLDEASDGHPDKFTARYNHVVRERDEARKEAERAKTIDAALTDRSQKLEADNLKLTKEYASAKKTVAKYNEERKTSPDLLGRLAFLEDALKTKAQAITEKDAILETVKDAEKVEALIHSYHRTWYTAAAGWGLFLVTALGLFTLIGQPKSALRPSDESTNIDPPPHRIA